MDGTEAMQSPVPPGGTFDYAFQLKDAGLFWFHPHVRSDVQVEKGLYGALRVTSNDEPSVDQERILVLDDVRVLSDGSLPTYLDDESKMLGRQGNILLVNGAALPTFRWRSGSLQRFHIVNVANGRFFNLALAGYRWRVIGTDGGWLPQPYDTDRLLVAPGERYDVALIASGEPGDEVTLMNDSYERGHDTGAEPPLELARFIVTDEPASMDRALPQVSRELERLPDGAADHDLVLDEGLIDGVLSFTINGQMYPDVPPLLIPAGGIRRFDIRNATEMDHPFHVHGTFFQILSANGVPVPTADLANKDTVIVPRMSTLRLVSRFEEPGRWMYHCHIFEHAEGGMMGEITVEQDP
jgi:FtsP/CotA-like multicopper oxidase with cupredoxin domain